jgi:hypothetical protein
MMKEMTSIEKNDTWSLIDLPPDRKPIKIKWMFKVKQDEHGAVSKHKARIVVKGYARRHSIDYDEVFSPMARLDLVHLLITLTAHEGWEMHYIEIKLTFLNDELLKEVYVEHPTGFIVASKKHKVFKLRKVLYGLYQVSRAWNSKLDDMLLSLGFQMTLSKHTIYVRWNSDAQLVVRVYVNDHIITGSDCDDIKSFKEEMAVAFKMSNLGLLHTTTSALR